MLLLGAALIKKKKKCLPIDWRLPRSARRAWFAESQPLLLRLLGPIADEAWRWRHVRPPS
jgi:hypothetical protein